MLGTGEQTMSKEKQNELLINDVESNNSVRIRNKRIDEMSEVICKSYAEKRDCETCPTEWCYAAEYATLLYHAGYRKQSEGEWEKLYDKAPRYVCTACNHLFNNKSYKYCPNCGAKMKGADNDNG